ncbi:unnamed protein product [Symbiodinium pilosum]|uniref:Uncharacterized protein n=1 Tax=Symbiodinium pilosum TaxID=2952 RepID=A0A812SE00_SYMPI|nr:unnamed protein product [Symbiodinium pilosum]
MAAFASEDNGQEGDLAAHDGGTDPESDNDDESIGDNHDREVDLCPLPDLLQGLDFGHPSPAPNACHPPQGQQPGAVQHAAVDAFSRIGKLTSIKMPWESPAMSAIFTDLSEILEPSLSAYWTADVQTARSHERAPGPAEARVFALVEQLQGPAFAKVVKSRQDLTPQEKRQRDWIKALNLWTDVCVRFRNECEPGLAASSASAPAAFRSAVLADVEACLGVKSPLTVLKRASSFSAWLRWRDTELPACSEKLSEAEAWQYVARLKADGAPPTKAEAFLGSVRFAHFVLGFKLDPVVDSKRVRGAAQQMFAGKEAQQQAQPLTVLQVLALHDGLADGSRHVVDRALCAYVLVALYGRARLSDLEQISLIKHDHDMRGGFLEILTRKHKGAKSAQKKTKFMPILVPAIGVHGKAWLHLLVDVFRMLDLPADGVIEGPLMKAPRDCKGKEFSCRAIESSEISAFLRAFLQLPKPAAGDRGVSSHSLKATCLSWVCTYGVSDRTQTVLGRHCKCAAASDAAYARDLCVGPTRELQNIITEIAQGNFRPDVVEVKDESTEDAAPQGELEDGELELGRVHANWTCRPQ